MSNTCDHIIPYGIEIEIASVKMLRYIRKDVYYEIYALFIDVCESYEWFFVSNLRFKFASFFQFNANDDNNGVVIGTDTQSMNCKCL